ncbi:MAG: threonine ammonia-lyase [Actinomycetota bacterium]
MKTINLSDMQSARDRGASVVLETPTLPSASFSRMVGGDIWLKAENLQRTGSFKIRGAYNALSLLSDQQKTAGVVAASAGNHAQGVALAASELGINATVYMPESAAIPKFEATRAYGADVVLAGANLAEATDHATAFSADSGASLIHPYDDPNIIAGQGTLGLELHEQLPSIDTVLVPIGGGGLISGTAMALKTLKPSVRVIGIQSEGVPTYLRARETGVATEITPKPTVADGIAVSRPSQMCFVMIEEFVDDIVTVSDSQATEAVALLLERSKSLVEPSGAVTVAALLNGIVKPHGRTVAVLSGGNVDLLLVGGVVRHGLQSRGRFASFRVTVPDEPGRLAEVLTTVGDLGANVLSVDHQREGADSDFGTVRIHITVETRSHQHIARIVDALAAYEISGTQEGFGSGS